MVMAVVVVKMVTTMIILIEVAVMIAVYSGGYDSGNDSCSNGNNYHGDDSYGSGDNVGVDNVAESHPQIGPRCWSPPSDLQGPFGHGFELHHCYHGFMEGVEALDHLDKDKLYTQIEQIKPRSECRRHDHPIPSTSA
ncbi:hypothetical protein PoB_002980600 [Plakobranchus ocellatus]|uniref:Uncharacterized protein n=1 Tax=Plakobranchus ocellatus TaxID=259542 RepID=A0AAV4A9E6_9GAST|nr:hypothetical protein PoB_002980600 [Plakobranchus ocellatus]